MNLMWISAMNGHTECLRLLMETAEDSNIVDCTDAYERYLHVLVIVSFQPDVSTKNFDYWIGDGRQGGRAGVHNQVKVLVKGLFSDNNSDVFELN